MPRGLRFFLGVLSANIPVDVRSGDRFSCRMEFWEGTPDKASARKGDLIGLHTIQLIVGAGEKTFHVSQSRFRRATVGLFGV